MGPCSICDFWKSSSNAGTLRLIGLLLQLLALMLYFKVPNIVALVSWFNVLLALARVFPWEEPGVANFFHQFQFDLLFLVAAHAGAVFYAIRKKRMCVSRSDDGAEGV
jgi:hypothetical protein